MPYLQCMDNIVNVQKGNYDDFTNFLNITNKQHPIIKGTAK